MSPLLLWCLKDNWRTAEFRLWCKTLDSVFSRLLAWMQVPREPDLEQRGRANPTDENLKLLTHSYSASNHSLLRMKFCCFALFSVELIKTCGHLTNHLYVCELQSRLQVEKHWVQQEDRQTNTLLQFLHHRHHEFNEEPFDFVCADACEVVFRQYYCAVRTDSTSAQQTNVSTKAKGCTKA